MGTQPYSSQELFKKAAGWRCAVTTQEIGRLGEQLAARYVQKQGYRLLAMNYRTRWGEIDLIAQDVDTVVFIEVKTRKDAAFAAAADAVTPAKQQRLRSAALQWLAEKGERPMRFDVIEVYTADRRVHHIPNAFI